MKQARTWRIQPDCIIVIYYMGMPRNREKMISPDLSQLEIGTIGDQESAKER